MNCLIEYCRHPSAKTKVVLSLVKGYRYQSFIDMTPVRMFFLYEIPHVLPMEKKRELLSLTLETIRYETNT